MTCLTSELFSKLFKTQSNICLIRSTSLISLLFHPNKKIVTVSQLFIFGKKKKKKKRLIYFMEAFMTSVLYTTQSCSLDLKLCYGIKRCSVHFNPKLPNARW